MNMNMKTIALMSLMAAGACAHSAFAEDAVACPDPAPASPWDGWPQAAILTAGTDTANAPVVETGRAYALTLTPSAGVKYAIAPYKPPVAGSFGGMLSLTISKTGVYSIGLSGKGWIDVVKGGATTLRSVAHAEGAACAAVHKTVDFQLEPGTYGVQIASASQAAITIEVVAK